MRAKSCSNSVARRPSLSFLRSTTRATTLGSLRVSRALRVVSISAMRVLALMRASPSATWLLSACFLAGVSSRAFPLEAASPRALLPEAVSLRAFPLDDGASCAWLPLRTASATGLAASPPPPPPAAGSSATPERASGRGVVVACESSAPMCTPCSMFRRTSRTLQMGFSNTSCTCPPAGPSPRAVLSTSWTASKNCLGLSYLSQETPFSMTIWSPASTFRLRCTAFHLATMPVGRSFSTRTGPSTPVADLAPGVIFQPSIRSSGFSGKRSVTLAVVLLQDSISSMGCASSKAS
mmetsp:Transcript_63890/g.169762  ORF Transcript_63890/g.169762 Transcript_63890/m.169762 type:complete len:294 (+) Transcript_63890:389-1270(+)